MRYFRITIPIEYNELYCEVQNEGLSAITLYVDGTDTNDVIERVGIHLNRLLNDEAEGMIVRRYDDGEQ